MRWPVLAILLLMGAAHAAIDPYEFTDPARHASYLRLTEELRCPKCQNQNIAESNAPLATDLRQRVYDMLNQGHNETEIRTFMVERYGDFVTYRPPLRPLTWPLWFGPFVIIGLVGLLLALWIRRRTAAGSEAALDERERARLQALLRKHDGPAS